MGAMKRTGVMGRVWGQGWGWGGGEGHNSLSTIPGCAVKKRRHNYGSFSRLKRVEARSVIWVCFADGPSVIGVILRLATCPVRKRHV